MNAGATWNRRDWVVFAAVFVVALGVRLFYLTQLSAPFLSELGPVQDGHYYDMRAGQIASGDFLGFAPGFLSPLYCHALGLVYFIFGANLIAAKVVQAVLGALSCVLLYVIAERLCSKWVSVLAATFLAVYGLHVYYTGVLLPTVLVVFLNLLLLAVFIRADGTPKPLRCVVGGLVLGLAALAKSNSLLLLPLVLIWLWVVARAQPVTRRALLSLALVFGAALSIAPITWENYKVSGQFVLIGTTAGENLLKGNGPTATGTHAFLPRQLRGTTGLQAQIQGIEDPTLPAEDSQRMTAAAWAHVREHPAAAVAMLTRKFQLFFNALELVIRDHFHFAQDTRPALRAMIPSFGLIAPIGLTGLLMSWPKRREFALLYGFLGIQVLSFVLVFVLARYRLAAVTCLMLFGAQLIAWWVSWFKAGEWKRLGTSVAVLLAVSVFVHLPTPDYPRERGFADQHSYLGNYYLRNEEYEKAAWSFQRAMVTDWSHQVRAESSRRKGFGRLQRALAKLEQRAKKVEILEALMAELEALGTGSDAELEGKVRRMLRPIKGASGR